MSNHKTNLDDFLLEFYNYAYDPLADEMEYDPKHGYYMGMMSGTSLDGLDVVLCQFEPTRLIATHTQAFDNELKTLLLALCRPNGTTQLSADERAYFSQRYGDELQSELDFFGLAARLYAHLCVQATNALLAKTHLNASDIDAIGVHGQTVRHRPNLGFSLQLIDPNVLAQMTGISVVSDFRRRDMAVGGQGAPLVPAFHQAMFHVKRQDNQQTVVLNLGGIANISVLGETVLGYDTGVANLLMDGWIHRHLGLNFDQDGNWAKSGKVQTTLLNRLLGHEFLPLPAPKSTGREDFNLSWLDGILSEFTDLAPQDVQATLCEFTAITACTEINKYQKHKNQLYVCGGGAYNSHLMARLAHHLPNWTIATTDDLGVNPTWVEAMCFAWLARQNLLGEPSNLPSVTGASRAVVLGQVCFA